MPERTWLTFRYRVGVVCLSIPPELQGLTRFLRQYFEPYFEVITALPNDNVDAYIEIELESSPRGAPDFGRGKKITVDASKAFLAMTGIQIDQSYGRWILLQPSGVIVHWRFDTRVVHVYSKPDADLRIVVLRLIEDIILNSVQRSGGIVLHSAAVVADGKAVAAIGNKGAGKTSFLCHALEDFSTSMLTNDNACIFLADESIVMCGWPSFFKASLGTVVSHPSLVKYAPNFAATLDDDKLWATYEKTALYPREAAEAFDSKVATEAPLAQLILPSFTRTRPASLTSVTVADVRPELEACLQGIHNPNHPEWLGLNSVDKQSVAEAFSHFIDSLERLRIPIARLNWAPGLSNFLRRLPIMRETDRLLRQIRRSDLGKAWEGPQSQSRDVLQPSAATGFDEPNRVG